MKKHKYLFVACLSLFPVMAVAGNDTLHEIMEVPSATNINKNRLYKGKVVDDRTSEPLVGATVKVKGSTIGTITDIDGNFALDIPDNISPIVFEVSYMGYASKEAAPAKTTGFTIRLAEDSQTLEEVQIIAYGKQSKMSVTAAISSIDTKELLKSPSGSVANALSGAVTGLSSIQPSGQPGAENPSIYTWHGVLVGRTFQTVDSGGRCGAFFLSDGLARNRKYYGFEGRGFHGCIRCAWSEWCCVGHYASRCIRKTGDFIEFFIRIDPGSA